MSVNFECRICYDDEKNKKALIHPCACDGTNRYVHRKCLNRWRLFDPNFQERHNKCMECNKMYIFIDKYPIENYKFHIFNSLNELVFKLGIINVFFIISSIILYTIDSHNIIIKTSLQILDVDYNVSDIDLYLLYFTSTTFFLTSVFHVLSSVIIYYNIHRKKHYFKLTYGIHSICVILSLHYLYLIYLIPMFQSNLIFYIMGLLSLFNPSFFIIIFENHNDKLDLLNKKFNKKIIKNLDKKMTV